MGLQIAGNKGAVLDVSPQGEVLAQIAATPAITQAALLRGDAYAWHSQDINIDTPGDTLIMLRNDSGSQDLVIDRIILVGGNANSRYEIHKVTVEYTPATGAKGAIIVGMNLGNSGTTADVECRSDEDGNTQGAVFAEGSLLAVTTVVLQMNLVLGKGQAVGIDQVAASIAGAATIFGYFVDRK